MWTASNIILKVEKNTPSIVLGVQRKECRGQFCAMFNLSTIHGAKEAHTTWYASNSILVEEDG